MVVTFLKVDSFTVEYFELEEKKLDQPLIYNEIIVSKSNSVWKNLFILVS